MQRIYLITLAKLREDYLRAAAAEYEKRLGGYCQFQTLILESARLPERPALAEIQRALEWEGEQILQKIPHGCFKVALCVEGKVLTSEQLAQKLFENASFGSGQMAFIIGSSYGLSPAVKKACELKLSLSAMTFPHRLAHIMLLEQLYRGYTILAGRGYHK